MSFSLSLCLKTEKTPVSQFDTGVSLSLLTLELKLFAGFLDCLLNVEVLTAFDTEYRQLINRRDVADQH